MATAADSELSQAVVEVDTSIKMDFFKFPPEIRNAIYSLLVIRFHPIMITSPRKKHQTNKILNPSSFCRVICVNKQMNQEAGFLFYARNTFAVGNGHWGSTFDTNLHGMISFVRRTSKAHLQAIREVYIGVQGREPQDGTGQGRCVLGTIRQSEELLAIARLLTRHFTGLDEIVFCRVPTNLAWYSASSDLLPLLTPEQACNSLVKTLGILLKGRLPWIEMRGFDHEISEIDMRGAVKKFEKMEPEAAKYVELVN